MPRKYTHIQDHEKEILELREEGMTLREIGETLGFSYKTVREFITRYNRRQRKLAAGIVPNRREGPGKLNRTNSAWNTTKPRMSA